MNPRISRPRFLLSLCTVIIIIATGCGGGGSSSTPPPPPTVAVAISPTTRTLDQGATATFSATVSNSSNQSVTWSVVEQGGGTISATTGDYTAPNAAGTFTVKATSVADSSKSATAAVTVRAVSISITPATLTLAKSGTHNFSATVTGTVDTAVTYSVQEEAGGSVNSTTGDYSAPAQWGVYHVIAKAHADATKTATATVTVPGSTPVFTSMAPAAATEGSAYTYQIAANDPDGTAITYSLVQGPTGATISGDTLTWTPTPTQSRIANDFTIKATTAAYGTATQDFSVSPNGTVTVKYGTTYIASDGTSTFVPITPPPTSILIADGAGGYTTIAGTVSSGQATISNVPAGKYLLKVGNPFYEKTASSVDLSTKVVSRAGVVKGSAGTVVNFQISGLNPLTYDDYLNYVSPNEGWEDWLYYASGNLGGTTATDPEDWQTIPLPDASKGDTEYINQMAAQVVSGTTVNVLKKSSGPLSLTVADGSTPTFAVPLSSPSATGTVRPNVDGAAFLATLTAAAPTVTGPSAAFGLYVAPQYGGGGDLVHSDHAPTSAFDLGDITYANPFPAAWAPSFYYSMFGTVNYALPGTTLPTWTIAQVHASTSALPTASSPITPMLGPVRNLRINGADFLSTSQTGVGLTPLITWDAPSLGTPTSYTLFIDRLYKSSPAATSHVGVAWFETTGTSIQVPSNILVSGETYFVHIVERQVSSSNFAQADVFTATVAP